MKKISIICLAGISFFAACENNNSSTVGTYENEETSPSVDKKEDTSKGHLNNKSQNAQDLSLDTAKNITTVSKDSADSHNKKDTSPATNQKRVKLQKTKKVETKP